MRASAAGRRPRFFLLGAALALAISGCNTSNTPAFPEPDLQVLAGAPFLLRVGDLALVAGAGSYVYVSVQSVGVDTRCPPEETCAEPGYLELNLDLETDESQGAVGMRIPKDQPTSRSFRGFELTIHEVQPPGRASRIPPIEYVFLMTVLEDTAG